MTRGPRTRWVSASTSPEVARRRHLTVAVLATLLTTSGCAGGEGTPAPGAASTSPAADAPVRIDTRRLAPGLLPADVSDAATERVGRLLFSGLVRYDAKGKAVDEVASSITTNDDRVYDVRLEPGWTFSNGEPVTAHSFVDAWNAAARRSTGAYRASAFAPIAGYVDVHGQDQARTTSSPTSSDESTPPTMAGLSVADDHHFTITLEDPTPGFPERLGDLAFAPLPATALRDPQTFARHPVGNGPYRLAGSWNPDAPLQLQPQQSYQGTDPARNAGLTLVPYADPASAYTAFVQGHLDVVSDVDPAHLASYHTTFGARALSQPIGAADALVFPVTRDPWRGAAGRLRRLAISRAVDRAAVTTQVYAGTRAPATDLAAPVVDGSSQDLCGDTCRHDDDAARESWSKAGGMSGPLRLAYAADSGAAPAVTALCAQITASLGVTCTGTPYPTEVALRSAVSDGTQTSPYLETWRMGRPALAAFLEPRFTSGSPANGSGYADGVVQTQLSSAATAPVPAQPDAYRRVETDILQTLPVVPLWSVSATAVSASTVRPVHVDAFGSPVYTQIARP